MHAQPRHKTPLLRFPKARHADRRVCRECASKRKGEEAAQKPCFKCGVAKAEDAFGAAAWKARDADRRVCRECASKRKGEEAAQKPCFKCGVAKAEEAFGAAAWKARHADRRVCKACAVKGKGTWRCAVCREPKACTDFSAWSRRRAARQDGTQRCNACVLRAATRAAAQRANDRLTQLRRRLARGGARP